ncbi:MAG: LAGLIDADG family homing endonuclease [Candidatus Omnitrophota bacterium]
MRVQVPPSAFYENPLFKPRWSSNLAYIVGLITTDGNLSKDGRHIDFTSSDFQLIKTFKKCLSLNIKIGRKYGSFAGTKSYRLQFGNVKLYRWLLKIGLAPNKTSNLGKINVPRRYFRDFLRGHLDGDGSIVTYIDRQMEYKGVKYKYQRLYLTFYSSSPKHLEWLRSTLRYFFEFKGSLRILGGKNRKIPLWRLRFAKYDSLKFLSWIYYKPNLPCLKRKRKIADRFLT